MKVYRNIDDLPIFSKAVITTGSFDGVHTGHVQIINQLLKEAEKINGTPVLITFYPHPKQIVQMEEKVLHILNTPDEKYKLLKGNGIKNIVVVPFTKSFSELSANEYIKNFLIEKFKPAVIVVGYDHRFGNNREGNFTLLKTKENTYNFEVKEIPEHVLKNITISSTKIRAAILDGDIEKAATYLGYNYFFNARIIEGNKLGRTIGYATANLQIEDEHKLIPANGVYAVDVEYKDRMLKGMMNIGIRPTIDGKKRTIEVNIFDFDEVIYAEIIKVTLKKRLRAEIKFDGLDALKNQLALDAVSAKTFNE